MHLARKPHGANVAALELGLIKGPTDGHQSRMPPVLRLLLCPAWLGHFHGLVIARGGSHNMTIRTDDDCPCAGGPNVNSHHVGHRFPSNRKSGWGLGA